VISGFLILDKPAGITSHDLVARARKILETKKIGHAGTLDPMATGLMVLGIESATRLLDYIVAGRKRYLATIKLGEITLTDDKEGEVIETFPVDESFILRSQERLKAMAGEIDQVPSSISAIKVAGKRAYQLARDGVKPELKPRKVTIHSLDILQERRIGSSYEIDIDVSCSAGTYIRSIARDIGGHLISLRRVEVAPFSIEDCQEIGEENIIPAATAMAKLMPLRNLTFEEVAELKFGRSLDARSAKKNEISAGISPEGKLVALLRESNERARPIAVFSRELG
jgi:tRNA pseudouridine55 synthase